MAAGVGPAPPGWRPTAALVRALTVAIGCLGLGLALGRADLAAIGAPFVLLLVMALSLRGPDRSRNPSATVRMADPSAVPTGGRAVGLEVRVAEARGAQFVSVAVPDPVGGAIGGTVTVPDAMAGRFAVWARLPAWGTLAVARPDVLAAGPDGLWDVGPVTGSPLTVAVHPDLVRKEPMELPPILGGWAGDHVSRRPGSGGDLIDLREYVPGDRLRSIHWRAYARHQQLYVRRTQSDADAEFVFCIDTRTDIRPQRRPATGWRRFTESVRRTARRLAQFLAGMVRAPRFDDTAPPAPPGSAGPSAASMPIAASMPTAASTPTSASASPSGLEASSLDLAVAAASALASAQLRIGDRVGVLDLSRWRRHVRMGTGTRHRERIRQQLAGLDAAESPWLVRAELWGLPPSSVVVIISALTDEAIVTAAADCHARGHQVIVVDALPSAALSTVAAADEQETMELDLLLAERELRLAPLRQRAIPVLRWEAGYTGAELRLLRRATRSRR